VPADKVERDNDLPEISRERSGQLLASAAVSANSTAGFDSLCLLQTGDGTASLCLEDPHARLRLKVCINLRSAKQSS